MVEKIGAVQQRGVLLAAATAGRQKGFDILIVVVIMLAGGRHADGRSDDLALFQRRAILRGHDADVIDPICGRAADDHRIETLHFAQALLPFGQRPIAIDRIDAILGDDVERGQIDGIDAFAKDGSLATFLSACPETPARPGNGCTRPRGPMFGWGPGFAGAGKDVAQLSLLDRDQRSLVNGVLPAPQAEMQSAAQHERLKTGFATARRRWPLRPASLWPTTVFRRSPPCRSGYTGSRTRSEIRCRRCRPRSRQPS